MPESVANGIGFAVVPFASALHQDTITITGEDRIRALSFPMAALFGPAALSADFLPPICSNIVPGVGFDITVRLAVPGATRQGPVRVHWIWF